MKLIINVDTGNAAFQDNPDELRNILIYAVNGVTGYNDRSPSCVKDRDGDLYDSNGNKVGNFKVTGR